MAYGPLVPPSESRYLRELRTDDDSLNEWMEKVSALSLEVIYLGGGQAELCLAVVPAKLEIPRLHDTEDRDS